MCRFDRDRLHFRAGKFGIQLISDRSGHFTFDAKDIVQFAVITFGPNMLVRSDADQLHIDVHGVGDLLHATLENVGNAQLSSDFA